jgi:hypothetical protein
MTTATSMGSALRSRLKEAGITFSVLPADPEGGRPA